MGVVYRARNLALDRVRALKVLAPGLSADVRFRERFRRESRLAASIEHPNVIPVHQAGEEDGHLYLAMRLVEGTRPAPGWSPLDGPLAPGARPRVIGAVAGGARRRPRGRAHPPRREAGQRARRRRRRRGPRLSDRLRDQPLDPQRRRDRDRHAASSSARPTSSPRSRSPGDDGRPARRRLRARRRPLLRAHRRGAVPARERARDAVRARKRSPAAAVGGRARALDRASTRWSRRRWRSTPRSAFPAPERSARALNAVVEDERTLSLDESPAPAPAVRHGARRRRAVARSPRQRSPRRWRRRSSCSPQAMTTAPRNRRPSRRHRSRSAAARSPSRSGRSGSGSRRATATRSTRSIRSRTRSRSRSRSRRRTPSRSASARSGR